MRPALLLPIMGKRKIVVPPSLYLYPNDLDNADWTKVRCSITANAAADPNGAMTADAIVEDGTTNTHFVYKAISWQAGSKYRHYHYRKPVNRDWCAIQIPGTVFAGAGGARTAYFDTASLSVGTVGTSFDDARIEAGPRGYAKITVEMTAVASLLTLMLFGPASADNGFVYAGVNGQAASYNWGHWLGVIA